MTGAWMFEGRKAKRKLEAIPSFCLIGWSVRLADFELRKTDTYFVSERRDPPMEIKKSLQHHAPHTTGARQPTNYMPH